MANNVTLNHGLTRENILAMEAGRELDALVAELVMGQHRTRASPLGDYRCPGVYEPRVPNWPPCLPHYSSEIAAAWAVVEKVMPAGQLGYWFDLYHGQFAREEGLAEWVCYMERKGPAKPTFLYTVTAPTAPLAICRAALTTFSDR